ncbi:MAG: BrnT family toxin [Mesorhizobium sp.]|nr:BrnT family toxin [Mesorhizobium sp.]
MELEWNEEKRRQALEERGLDFADVAKIDMSTAMTTIDNRQDYGEQRFVTYGYIEGRLYVVCWTERDDRMRVISFRKANDREQKIIASASERPPPPHR